MPSRVRIDVKSAKELRSRLQADVSDRADMITRAIGDGVSKDVARISKTTGHEIVPEVETSSEGERHAVKIFVSSEDKDKALEARKEEFLGSRPFATIHTALQSKAILLKLLKREGVQ